MAKPLTESWKEHGKPSILYERELALLVKDLSRRIFDLENPKFQLRSKKQKLETIATIDPFGVTLIVSNSDNPFRHALAPLAASIAVKNVVILVLSPRSQVIRILQAGISKYVDSNAVFIVEQGNSAPEWDVFDHVLISGKCFGDLSITQILNILLSIDNPIQDRMKSTLAILLKSRGTCLLWPRVEIST